MPNIDDLKNNGNEKEPFIPTVRMDGVDDMDDHENQANKSVMRMGNRRTIRLQQPQAGERTAADLSSLPKADTPGVDKRISKVDDIFHEGGPFDEYIARKNKEMAEEMAKIESDPETARQFRMASKVLDTDASIEEAKEMIKEEDEESVYEDDDLENGSDFDIRADDYSEDNEVSMFADEAADSYPDYAEEAEEQTEEAPELVDNPEGMADYDQDFTNVSYEMPDPPAEESNDEESVTEEEYDFHYNGDTTPAAAEEPATADSDDEDGEEDSEDEELDEEEIEAMDMEDDSDSIIKTLAAQMKTRLNIVSEKIDLKGWVVAKPVRGQKLLAMEPPKTARWVLPNTGTCVAMRALTGVEVENLREAANNDRLHDVLRILYSAVISPKSGLESWTRSILSMDLDHLFFCAYLAAFGDSNYLTVNCDRMKEGSDKIPAHKNRSFVTENIPVSKMLVFKDDDTKRKFDALYKSGSTAIPKMTPQYRVAISTKYAFDLVFPSMYSTLIENTIVSDTYRRKHLITLSFLPYIGEIYKMDPESHSLIPLHYDVVRDSVLKTTVNKVKTYEPIINNLSNDEFGALRQYTNAIDEATGFGLTYQIPEATCPICGKVVAAQTDVRPSQMLFTRNQLGLLATTAVN